jgi:hypothetical protein
VVAPTEAVIHEALGRLSMGRFLRQYGQQLLSALAGAALGVGLSHLATSGSVLAAIGLTLAAIALLILILLTGVLHSRLDNLQIAFDETSRRIGVDIVPQTIVELNSLPSLDLDIMHRAVLAAQHELLAFDLLAPNGNRPDVGSMKSEVYQKIGTDIIELVHKRGKAFRYERIIQARSPERTLKSVTDPILTSHIREMLSLRSDGFADVGIKVGPHRYPHKFFLMDHKDAILQLHRINDRNEPEIWCELLIRNVPEPLLGVFDKMWRDLSEADKTRGVRESDLATAANSGRSNASHSTPTAEAPPT